MNKACIPYLAGLIEGEGYLKHYIYNRKFANGKYYINKGICLSVAMTDRDVIHTCGRVISEFLGQPVKVRGPLYNGVGCKDMYEVRVYGDRAYAMMVAIFPLMGSRRQQAIKEAVEVYKTMKSRKFKQNISKEKNEQQPKDSI